MEPSSKEREALKALIEADSKGGLNPAQLDEAATSALEFREFGRAVAAIGFDNGEMPFVATYVPPKSQADA